MRKDLWWTGEDSNLRSSQGAADLQSAAINHSATCPFPLQSAAQSEATATPGSTHSGAFQNDSTQGSRNFGAYQPSRKPNSSRTYLERETGIEPATNSLEGCDSTTELLPLVRNFWSRRPELN